MSRRRHAHRRPKGTLRRFVSALVVLLAVLFGIPAGLVVLSRLGLDASHPFPEIGSSTEIRSYLDRELSPTEITPIAIRALLIVAWALWAAMIVSIVAALFDARGSRAGRLLPQFSMFVGLGHWIAAGLTAFSSLAPNFVSAASLASPRPFTISAAVPTATVHTERPIRAGFARVQQGESAETFAQRTLGDPARWPEIWEINAQHPVGPTGEVWTQAWRLAAGWDLRLPPAAPTSRSTTVPAPSAPATSASTLAAIVGDTPLPLTTDPAIEYRVVAGDSYWSIAQSTLGEGASGHDIASHTETLIAHNAPRLGYSDPAMLRPGDVIALPATPPPTAPAATPAAAIPGEVPQHVVEPGDSYWEIAETTLGDEATGTEVLEMTNDLIDLNNPLLGYDERPMIHPGDVVYLQDPATFAAPAATAPVAAPLPPPAPPEPATTATTPDPAPVEEAPIPGPSVNGVDTPQTVTPPTTAVDEHDDSENTIVSPMTAGVAGITVLAAAGATKLFISRRRRAARGRPHERPAPLDEDLYAEAAALLFRETSVVTWLGLELRWLAQHCPSTVRSSLIVELVQIGENHQLEVAFAETPIDAPPPGWSGVAEHVWRLDRPHTGDELAECAELPPVVPALATLGEPDHGQLYLNLEAQPGINLIGDQHAAIEWVTNLVWEIAGEALAERADVLLVDIDLPGIAQLDNVCATTSTAALQQLAGAGPDRTPSMFERRSSQREGWDTTVVVLGPWVDHAAWAEVATRADLAVIALGGALPQGLDIGIDNGSLSVAKWNLAMTVASLNEDTAADLNDLLVAADEPPVADDLIITPAPDDIALTELDEEENRGASVDGEPAWQPPTWPVIVHLLGQPYATSHGATLELTPQQLSTLAYIAMKRQVSNSDLRDALWSADEDVPEHRISNLISDLRKAVGGGFGVISKKEDGIVRAGVELGTDLMLFEALNERANTNRGEWLVRRRQMLETVTGRPYGYPGSVERHWRWADLANEHSTWQHRVVTAASELAEFHLREDDPATALRIAHQALVADPLSAPATELAMRSYSSAGELSIAKQVFESHDRTLSGLDLGGASEETRRVFDRLCAAAAAGDAEELDVVAEAS